METFWGVVMTCVLVFGLVYSLTRKGSMCPWGCPACRRCVKFSHSEQRKDEVDAIAEAED